MIIFVAKNNYSQGGNMLPQDDYIRVMMTEEDKALINKAATLLGETLSSYVRRTMRQAARKVIREES
jgi:uncharacterized protein (DUF1778 family)